MKRYTRKKKLRILIPLYYYFPYVSGVSVYAKKLAEGLAAAGHKITILTSQHENELAKSEVINGVSVVRRPVLFKKGKGVVMPMFWLDVVRYSWVNDIVNCHLPMPDTGLSSLFIPKRKLVTTYQCDIKLSHGLIDQIIVSLSFLLMSIQLIRSKYIVTLSNDYFMHSRMNRYLLKSHPIYPLVNPNEFRPRDFKQFQKKLKLNTRQLKIGFMGRIVYEKGISYLLESIPEIAKSFKEFKIIIAGDYQKIAGGSIKGELDFIIAKYPDNIIFTGYLSDDELRQFYSMIDILVLPSIDPLEAFGMVQVEAMLCGTPVIASNLPGVREVINRTGYGLLSEPKNPIDIAQKITLVIANKNKYAPIRKNVIEIFNPKTTIDSYVDLMS